MAEYKLEAKKREISTKGYVNQLRKSGNVPGVVYSNNQAPINFYVDEIKVNPIIFTNETHMVSLEIEKEEPIRCIVKDVQFDPVSDRVIHLDFYAVTVGEAIQLEVPINIVGQAIGVKEGGNLAQQLHKAEVECLPKDMPDSIEVDVTELNVGESIHISDLKVENVTFLNSEDTIVVSVLKARSEEEETTDELLDDEDQAEPEVISKGKADEDSE